MPSNLAVIQPDNRLVDEVTAIYRSTKANVGKEPHHARLKRQSNLTAGLDQIQNYALKINNQGIKDEEHD